MKRITCPALRFRLTLLLCVVSPITLLYVQSTSSNGFAPRCFALPLPSLADVLGPNASCARVLSALAAPPICCHYSRYLNCYHHVAHTGLSWPRLIRTACAHTFRDRRDSTVHLQNTLVIRQEASGNSLVCWGANRLVGPIRTPRRTPRAHQLALPIVARCISP